MGDRQQDQDGPKPVRIIDPFPAGDLPGQIVESYLRAIEDGWLPVERCADCQRPQWYPRGFCVACGSEDVALVPVGGSGRLYTYSIVHRPPSGEFLPFVPYVYALVDLAEGVRVTSWITDCEHNALRIGMPLRLHFITGPGGGRLAAFRPATGSLTTSQGA
jgi:uncharacterized OB-fold protein